MFSDYNKNIRMLQGCYRKLKSYYYYNKNFIIMRKKIAEFESDHEQMESTFEMLSYCLCHPYSASTKAKLESLLNNIDFLVLPKKFVSGKKHENVVSNVIPKDKNLNTVNFFIDAPIEIYILDTLWSVFLGKMDSDNHIISTHAYGNTINQSIYYDNSSEINFDSRLFFNRYFNKYTEWRNNAFSAIENNYESNKDSLLISIDIKSYFYSVIFNFNRFCYYFNKHPLITQIRNLTKIMRCVYDRYLEIIIPFRKDFPNFKKNQYPLPIGLFSSMILANVYLKRFDCKMLGLNNRIYYGRYVDDVLLVLHTSEESDNIKLIINKYLVKTNVLKKSFINGNYYLNDYKNLIIQSDKIKVLYIDHRESRAIIDIYNDQIKIIPSQANPIPENEFDLLSFDEVAYDIKNFSKESKIRDIGEMKIDSFKVARFFSYLTYNYAHIDVTSNRTTVRRELNDYNTKIEKFFTGSQRIEYYTNWLNYMYFLVITQDNRRLKEFISLTKKQIALLNSKSIDKSIYKKPASINKKAKNALLLHLNICEKLALSLDFKMVKSHFSSKEATVMQYINSNMFQHNYVAFPLVNYLEYNPQVSYIRMSLSDISKYPKNIESSFKFIWSPRFIHYDELMLMLFYNYHKEQNHRNSKLFLDKQLVDKFALINHIGYEPFSIRRKPDFEFSDYVIREILIPNNETPIIPNLQVSIGSIMITEEDCYNGYQRWNNITIEKKVQIFNILKEAFKYHVLNNKNTSKPMLIVLPEACFPIYWINDLIRFAKSSQIGIVTGLQLLKDGNKVYNYIASILPFESGKYNYRNVFISIREKNDYSPHEYIGFAKHGLECKNLETAEYSIFHWNGIRLASLVCFELTDIVARALLKGKCNVLAVPELNPDTAYFSNIIESTARDLHAFLIQANTAYYGDSRVTAPYNKDNKDLIKIKGGANEHVVIEEIKINDLLTYQFEYQINLEKEITNAKSKTDSKEKNTERIKPLPARFRIT